MPTPEWALPRSTLRRGDRTSCLSRDCDVVITGESTARIPWPRCRALGTHGGGSGILVDEELARAIRTESASAVGYWWGTTNSTVAWWRRVLGVTKVSNAGSNRIVRAAAKLGAAAIREHEFTPEEREARRANAIRNNLRQHLAPYSGANAWPADQVAMLGKLPDEKVAKRTGRPVNGVRLKRTRLGIPNVKDRRRSENRA